MPLIQKKDKRKGNTMKKTKTIRRFYIKRTREKKGEREQVIFGLF